MGKSKTSEISTTTTTTTRIPPGQLNVINIPSTVSSLDLAIEFNNTPENTDKETFDRSGHFYFTKGPKRKVLFSFNSDNSVVTFTTDFNYRYTPETLSSALVKFIRKKGMPKVEFKSVSIQLKTIKKSLRVLEMRSPLQNVELANKHLLQTLTGIISSREHQIIIHPSAQGSSIIASSEMENLENNNTPPVTDMNSFIQPGILDNIQPLCDLLPENNEETNQLSQCDVQKVVFPVFMGENNDFLVCDDSVSGEGSNNNKKRKADSIVNNAEFGNIDKIRKQDTKQQKTNKTKFIQIKNKIITLENGDKISNIFMMRNGKEILCQIENDKVKFTALNAEDNYSQHTLCVALKKRFKNAELNKFVTFTGSATEGLPSCYMKLNEGQPTITLHKALKELISKYKSVYRNDGRDLKESNDPKGPNKTDTETPITIPEPSDFSDEQISCLIGKILNDPVIEAAYTQMPSVSQSQSVYRQQNLTFFGTSNVASSESPPATHNQNKNGL